jgi:arylsulfatase A-like enzyme
MLAGALEAVQLGATLRLDMGLGQGMLLSLCCIGLGALVGLGMSLPATLVMRIWGRYEMDWWRHAQGLGLVGAGLAIWYLWPVSLAHLRADRMGPGLAFLAVPVLLGLVVAMNAAYWSRRVQWGAAPKHGWLPVASGISLLVGAGAALGMASATYGNVRALEDDPAVVLVTIDTLRRDHLSIYGELPPDAADLETPVFDALAAQSILFTNAITPMPETAPAHAAMMTGRHPVRSGVLSNGHTLSAAHETLAEVLAEEGYATGAFVSSFAVDGRTGLAQGFQAYDDDFFPWVRGFSSIALVERFAWAFMRLGDPTDLPFLLERPAPVTFGRALEWVEDRGPQPFFLWVHLFDPHSPYEAHGLPGFEENGTQDAPSVDHRWVLSNESEVTYDDELEGKLRRLYAEEVAFTDRALGTFFDGLDGLLGDRPVIKIVTADHGEMLGEHEIHFNHHGIHDPNVRVPLLIQPHTEAMRGSRVDTQVRLMDIPATVLGLIKLDAMDHSEGVDLRPWAQGRATKSLSSLLMGRKTASLSAGTLFGYRAKQPGGGDVKLILDVDAGEAQLFDLVVDPGEQDDRAAEQPAAVSRLRAAILTEVGELASGIPLGEGVDPGTREALEALGYVD